MSVEFWIERMRSFIKPERTIRAPRLTTLGWGGAALLLSTVFIGGCTSDQEVARYVVRYEDTATATPTPFFTPTPLPTFTPIRAAAAGECIGYVNFDPRGIAALQQHNQMYPSDQIHQEVIVRSARTEQVVRTLNIPTNSQSGPFPIQGEYDPHYNRGNIYRVVVNAPGISQQQAEAYCSTPVLLSVYNFPPPTPTPTPVLTPVPTNTPQLTHGNTL